MNDKTVVTRNVDMSVSQQDVVDAFVARYETSLKQKMAEIKSLVVATKKEISDIHNSVIEAFKQTVTPATTKVAGVDIKIELQHVDFQHDFNETILRFRLLTTMKLKGYEEDDCCNTEFFTAPVEKSVRDDLIKHERMIESLNEQFVQYNNELRSIDSKQRQIRGMLAERRLKEVGGDLAELFNDVELLKAIGVENVRLQLN